MRPPPEWEEQVSEEWPLSGMSRHMDTQCTDGEIEAWSGGEQTGVICWPARLGAKYQKQEGQANREPRGMAESTQSSGKAWGAGRAEPQREVVEGGDG